MEPKGIWLVAYVTELTNGLKMNTELLLGSLASLALARVIIAVMTTHKRDDIANSRNSDDGDNASD